MYLPSGIGGIFAAYGTGKVLDRDYHAVAKAHNLPLDKGSIDANDLVDHPIEKARLRSVFALLAISASATLGYGWALNQRAHLSVPLVLQFLTGASQVGTFVVCGTLLTDLNPDKSATVQASYNLVRCTLSAAGVAALQAGIDSIGAGWTFTIYAALALACIPLFWLLRGSGWAWRRSKHDKIERRKDTICGTS